VLKKLNIAGILQNSDRSSKAKRQILFSFMFKGLSILIGIVYIPLMLDCLSQEKYGVWLTLVSIFGWLGFFDIGLGNGLRNKLAEAFATDNIDLAKRYVSTTYFLLACIFSTVLLLFHLGNYFINWNAVLNTQDIPGHELYLLTSIVFTFVIVRFVFQLIAVIYKADQKSSISDIIDSLGNTVSFSLVYIISFTSLKDDLVLLGSAISVVPVFLFILASLFAFKGKYRHISPSIKKIDIAVSKGILSLGGKFFFMQVTAIVLFTSSNFLVAQFYGPSEVVIYNIAFKYFQIPTMIYSIIASPIWSAATDAYYKNDFEWLKKTLRKLNILTLLFAVGILIMVFVSPLAYKIWFGGSVIIPELLTYAMAVYSLTFVVIIPYSYFINGFGKIRLSMILTIVELSIYIGTVFILGNTINSSVSIVISFIISRILLMIVQPIQIHKILNRKATGIWNM